MDKIRPEKMEKHLRLVEEHRRLIEFHDQISDNVFELLGEDEKVFKGDLRDRVNLPSRVEDLLQELPHAYLQVYSGSFVWTLVPLLRDFYRSGQNDAYKEARLIVEKNVKEGVKEWKEVTQDLIDKGKETEYSLEATTHELRNAHGAIKRLKQAKTLQRRPSKEELFTITDSCRKKNQSINYSKLCKHLKITDKTAKEWCRFYGIK